MAWVSTQTLPNYSVSTRAKLTLPQYVVKNMSKFFHPELQQKRKADLYFFLDGPNEGRPPFEVTASLQKLETNGVNGVRVVLLEKGWKPIVTELGLKEGDTVSIYLRDKLARTYLIQVVERAPRRMEFDLNVPAQPNMEIDLNQPNQPVKFEFDLNEPAQPNMEIDLNQPNQPVRFEFDLNEPAYPNM